MKKFDVFIRSSRARKWHRGMTMLAYSSKEAAEKASDRFLGRWVKVLPAIIVL